MKKRSARLSVIMDLLTDNKIGNQEELSRLLADRGFDVTQATLSRDLRTLKIVKTVADDGSYRYVAKHEPDSDISSFLRKETASLPQALSIDVSGNIVVIKTRNGYASGLAYDIDLLRSEHVLGTIPGADTVFVVVNENSSRADIFNLFRDIMPVEVMEKSRSQFFEI